MGEGVVVGNGMAVGVWARHEQAGKQVAVLFLSLVFFFSLVFSFSLTPVSPLYTYTRGLSRSQS